MDDFNPFEGGGYFDDDGNEINPDLIPKPGLCLLCKLNDINDPEENVLCNLTRVDQKDEPEFICHKYDPINKI